MPPSLKLLQATQLPRTSGLLGRQPSTARSSHAIHKGLKTLKETGGRGNSVIYFVWMFSMVLFRVCFATYLPPTRFWSFLPGISDELSSLTRNASAFAAFSLAATCRGVTGEGVQQSASVDLYPPAQ